MSAAVTGCSGEYCSQIDHSRLAEVVGLTIATSGRDSLKKEGDRGGNAN
jgi:hypothetical protein